MDIADNIEMFSFNIEVPQMFIKNCPTQNVRFPQKSGKHGKPVNIY